MKPYTYFIFWRETGQKYYGCQYGANANPENILNHSYKTSSKYVKNYWDLYGPPDTIVIHRIFNTAKECREYEHFYLTRVGAIKKPDWLNKTNNKAICTDNYNPDSWKNSHQSRKKHLAEDEDFRKYMADKFINAMQSESASIKRKQTFKERKHSQGKNNPRFGAILAPETLTKISEARKKQYSLNKANADRLNQKNKICEYCNKTGLTSGNYRRWHGDKCSRK